jgi:hypothetical protein
MPATATSALARGQRTELDLDRDWARAFIGRWEAAQEYVHFLDLELLPSGHALRQVIGEDFPKIMKELIRLRPDLG